MQISLLIQAAIIIDKVMIPEAQNLTVVSVVIIIIMSLFYGDDMFSIY